MIKKILSFIIFIQLYVIAAFGTNFPIPAGSNTATIQSIFNTAFAAPGANTITFAAGTYSITSTVNYGCPSGSIGITGAISLYPYKTNNTLQLNGTVTGGWGFAAGACTKPVTWQYFNWNGGEPASGGGGFAYESPGNSNVTFQYFYITGMYANFTTGHEYDGGIYFDGPQAQTPIDSNDTVQWGTFGDGSTTCNLIMNSTTYQGGSAYGEGGAYCNGIGVHVSNSNFTAQYNNFNYLEQGMKFYAGTGTQNQPSTQIIAQNANIQYNWFHQIHRFALEAQQVPNPLFNTSYNVCDLPVDGSYSTGCFSIPMCCSPYVGIPGPNNVRTMHNTQISNPAVGNSISANEWWSQDQCSNNFVQGTFGAGGCWWGEGEPPWASNYNICQLTNGGTCLDDETGDNDGTTPTSTGNQTSTTLAQLTSPNPSISPTPSGSYSSPITVTINAPTVFNSGVGPQGPYTAYYTTDGSTPTTSSTTCNIWPVTSCTISVAPGTKVSTLALWGTPNMPRTWTAPYGWKPSSVVSATYTSGSGPTLTSITLTTTGGATSFAANATNQLIATGHYSDSSTANISSSVTWASSNTSIGTVSSTGLFTAGTTAGTTNISATSGSINSTPAPFTLTVTANPTIVSCGISQASNINTVAVGGTIPFTTQAVYSDGITRNVPDAYGNVPNWRTTAGTGTGTVTNYVSFSNPGGLYTATAAGTAHVFVVDAGVGCSSWDVTNTAAAATLTSITLTSTGGVTHITTGSTLQLIATGTYSDGSTANITSTINSWSTSNSSFATINSSGLVTGIAAGVPTFTATQGSITSAPPLPLTITASIVLNSITLSQATNVNMMHLGWTLPFTAVTNYSDGSTGACYPGPDAQGNTCSFISSNTSAATFTGNILKEISGSAGNGYVTATSAGVTSNQYPLTYLGLLPAIFDITGAQITVKGSTISIQYH